MAAVCIWYKEEQKGNKTGMNQDRVYENRRNSYQGNPMERPEPFFAAQPLWEKVWTIAAFSPRQTVLAASFLVGLYALKSLSVCFPMSALTAAGGLLFPFPLALAVNLCGTGVVLPHFLQYLSLQTQSK